MSVQQGRRILELFEQALSLQTDKIPAFLENADATEAVKVQVRKLLDVSELATGVFPDGDRTLDSDDSGVKPGTPAPESALQPGDRLGDRYVVSQMLGAGGIGQVYRGTDSRLGREIAIKVLHHNTLDDSSRQRFEREMHSAASLSHANVMAIHDVGEHRGILFAVMELVKGRSLRSCIDSGLSVEAALRIGQGIASGLAAAHERGLMHRDIKPENVMVADNGNVKVLDFGLARPETVSTIQNVTNAHAILGTVPYMSPEQAEGHPLTCATDLFSLGIVLFEMLTQTNPFRGETLFATLRNIAEAKLPKLHDWNADLPAEIETLVAAMLDRNAEARPSAGEVAAELMELSQAFVDEEATAERAAPKEIDTSRVGDTSQVDSKNLPKTRYARCGDVHIAYQVFGNGPTNLVLMPGFISNIDNYWTSPDFEKWLLSLADFARVAMFDKRGTGLSDRVANLPSMEERIEDVCTVMDAVGFESAAVLGISEGGSLASLFAALYPDRCDALILHGSFARFRGWFPTQESLEQFFDYIRSSWGSGTSLPFFAPTLADDPELQEWWGRFERLGANPTAAIDLMKMNSEIDITGILSSIRTPTLVIRRAEDTLIDPAEGQFLADNIRGAKLITSPGPDHIPFLTAVAFDELEAVREFLQHVPGADSRESVLATVLAVKPDQRGSGGTTSEVEHLIGLHNGKHLTEREEVIYCSFDGPVRAVRCAKAIAASTIGWKISVDTGETLLIDETVAGKTAEQTKSMVVVAPAGQVIVTQMVKDLVAGSGLRFEAFAGGTAIDSLPPLFQVV